MLNYNDIKPRRQIILGNEPYEVLTSHIFRKQQRKPVNQTTLRHLLTGKVIEHSFHMNDKVAEAEIASREAKFLYVNRGEYWFSDLDNPASRFSLLTETVGELGKFMKQNSTTIINYFNDKPFSIGLPIKVDLRVSEAPPNVRGNTAQGAVKQVVLETGATVTTPMFINQGDTVRINTETGEYVERV